MDTYKSLLEENKKLREALEEKEANLVTYGEHQSTCRKLTHAGLHLRANNICAIARLCSMSRTSSSKTWDLNLSSILQM